MSIAFWSNWENYDVVIASGLYVDGVVSKLGLYHHEAAAWILFTYLFVNNV